MKIQWLASYPKSGNTWVRAFLSAYCGQFDLNRMDFVASDNQPALFQMCCPEPFHQVDLYGSSCVRLAMLYAVTAQSREPLILKTHECNATVGDVPLIPEGLSGPSVYLVRDPRDVAVSYADHMGIDIDTAITRITGAGTSVAANTERGSLPQVLSSWDRNVNSWASRKYVRVVRFEDLLEDQQVFRVVLKQYGIEYNAEKFHDALVQTSFDRLRQAEEDQGFREKGKRQARFFRSGQTGQWREVLTDEQVGRLEAAFGSVMEQWGYRKRVAA